MVVEIFYYLIKKNLLALQVSTMGIVEVYLMCIKKPKRNINRKREKMINKILILVTIISIFTLTGCSTKQEHHLTKVPHNNIQKDIAKASFYEVQRKKKLAKVITQKVMPLKTPDTILRVLTMPYVDDKQILQTQNFHYIVVDKGQWVLGEYLLDNSLNTTKEFTPLRSKKIK
jgi:hypothetical protein